MPTNAPVREHGPVKQGLRHVLLLPASSPPIVREHGPVKQGLRPRVPNVIFLVSIVREHGPVKQGLRLSQVEDKLLLCEASESMVQ